MNAIIFIAGLLSVYIGYRMFCSVSRRTSSMVSGALLAMLGMGIVVGEAKAFVNHRTPASGVHRSPNWRNGAAPSVHRDADRQSIV
jgi:hypothetical protein